MDIMERQVQILDELVVTKKALGIQSKVSNYRFCLWIITCMVMVVPDIHRWSITNGQVFIQVFSDITMITCFIGFPIVLILEIVYSVKWSKLQYKYPQHLSQYGN